MEPQTDVAGRMLKSHGCIAAVTSFFIYLLIFDFHFWKKKKKQANVKNVHFHHPLQRPIHLLTIRFIDGVARPCDAFSGSLVHQKPLMLLSSPTILYALPYSYYHSYLYFKRTKAACGSFDPACQILPVVELVSSYRCLVYRMGMHLRLCFKLVSFHTCQFRIVAVSVLRIKNEATSNGVVVAAMLLLNVGIRAK